MIPCGKSPYDKPFHVMRAFNQAIETTRNVDENHT